MLQLLSALGDTSTYSQSSTWPAAYGIGLILGSLFICVVIMLVAIVGLWKVYTKAGKPGWAFIVPIYSGWVLAEIAGKPGWWTFLLFIPIVNIVISLLIAINLARNFGKSDVFGVVGLWLFSFIGYLILGFGKATYQPLGGQNTNATGASPTSQPPTPPIIPSSPSQSGSDASYQQPSYGPTGPQVPPPSVPQPPQGPPTGPVSG